MQRAPDSSPDADPPRHVVIVGGGISGLAAAERLLHVDPRVRVTLLEADQRLGGIIGTERVDGFVLERGPDVFVTSKPAARELCARLGIADRLTGFAPGVRGAYVYRRGRLRPLPAGFSGLLPTRVAPLATSGLLSPLGLLRAATEPLRRAPASPGDESVEAFAVRRVGRELYERLMEPLLTGIYAGDGARLSLDATFPQLRALEREHGSLLRGIRAQRAAAGGKAPAHPPFMAPRAGMQELIDALERNLRDSGRVDLRLGTAVAALAPAPGEGAVVTLADGTPLRCDAVIVATPAPAAAALLAPLDAELARDLAAIELGSAATVTLAFRATDVARPLDATGYVVPRIERRPVLACTWTSSKFAGRAPAGTALFRLFLGGARHPEQVELDDDALVALARTELRETLGVAAEPTLVRVVRWRRAMPQYHVGHAARVERIEARVAAVPWLALAGNAYRGVGIPDCVRSGQLAADRVAAGVGKGGLVGVA
jgi:oxygen-dependent protoporphyrinogen oxidase